MKKEIFGDKLGTPIDKYALLITLFIIGVFLHLNSDFLVSEALSRIVSSTCLSLSCIMLVNIGRNLEKKEILGVPEMAIGAFQSYFISTYVSNKGYLSIFVLFSIAFFLFNFIGGSLALLCSYSQYLKNKKAIPVSKAESLVGIITSFLGCVFAGIQLFLQ